MQKNILCWKWNIKLLSKYHTREKNFRKNSKEYKKGDGRKVPLDINLLEKIIQEHGVWNLCKTFVFLHASHQY